MPTMWRADLLRGLSAHLRHAYPVRVLMGIPLLVGPQWRLPVTKKDFDLLFNEYELIVLSRMEARASPRRPASPVSCHRFNLRAGRRRNDRYGAERALTLLACLFFLLGVASGASALVGST